MKSRVDHIISTTRRNIAAALNVPERALLPPKTALVHPWPWWALYNDEDKQPESKKERR